MSAQRPSSTSLMTVAVSIVSFVMGWRQLADGSVTLVRSTGNGTLALACSHYAATASTKYCATSRRNLVIDRIDSACALRSCLLGPIPTVPNRCSDRPR